jgi:hypothetical protein
LLGSIEGNSTPKALAPKALASKALAPNTLTSSSSSIQQSNDSHQLNKTSLDNTVLGEKILLQQDEVLRLMNTRLQLIKHYCLLHNKDSDFKAHLLTIEKDTKHINQLNLVQKSSATTGLRSIKKGKKVLDFYKENKAY